MLARFWLQHSDEYANERNEIQRSAKLGVFMWGVWINTSKNPRLKVIEFSHLQVNVEVPKQIALASVALRVQVLPLVPMTTLARLGYSVWLSMIFNL
jgi:hypothetical protein